jgi:hypothetical protein
VDIVVAGWVSVSATVGGTGAVRYAFNAKKAALDGVAWLHRDEATERLNRARA